MNRLYACMLYRVSNTLVYTTSSIKRPYTYTLRRVPNALVVLRASGTRDGHRGVEGRGVRIVEHELGEVLAQREVPDEGRDHVDRHHLGRDQRLVVSCATGLQGTPGLRKSDSGLPL